MSTLSPEGLHALLKDVGADVPIPFFQDADPHRSPMDLYKSYLAQLLVRHTSCDPKIAHDAIQWPSDHGDLVVAVPRLRLKDVDKKQPSEQLRHDFPQSPLFGFPFADGVLLRCFFSSHVLAQLLIPYIVNRGSEYGINGRWGPQPGTEIQNDRKKIIVEFSSPNLGERFDGNHLRSTLIGASVASLYERAGFEVHRLNFFGDWGKHVGGLAVGWTRFGSKEELEADPLGHLLDIYTKADRLIKAEADTAQQHHADQDTEPRSVNGTSSISDEKEQFFKQLEDGGLDQRALWCRFRDASVSRYKDLYARLNVTFDGYSGESEVTAESIAEVENKLREHTFLEESDGAWIVDFKSHGYKTLGKGVIRSKNGTSSYLLRDVAAALDRSRKYDFEKMIYVVASKQDLHFQQVFKILELIGYSDIPQRLQHINFGRVDGLTSRPDAPGLLLGDIIDHSQASLHKNLKTQEDTLIHDLGGNLPPEILETLATLNLMTHDLSTKRSTTLTWNLDKMPNPEEYTGMTLHHTLHELHSRLHNQPPYPATLQTLDVSTLSSVDEYTDALRLLAQFPDIADSAFKATEPSTVLNYLFRVTDQLLRVWEVEIENQDSLPDKRVRLAFYECARLVLENGMRMVGLVPVREL